MFIVKVVLCLMSVFAQPVWGLTVSGPNLGKIASDVLVANWNRDVFPGGEGLPPGRGNAVEGEQVYKVHCQRCHGIDGQGNSADELAGAQHSLTDNPPDKTIATYWPYATTVFDFTRRAMPLDSPGILSDNELYAVTAYLLFISNIISQYDEMSAITLPKVEMPNRNGFVNIYKAE